MEEEDELVKPIDPPSSEQCGTVSSGAVSDDSSPPVSGENESKPASPVDERREGLAGEGEVVEAVDREKSENESESGHAEQGKLVHEEQGMKDEILKVELLPQVTEVDDSESKNEEMSGEGEGTGRQEREVVDISIEVEGDKIVEAEELLPATGNMAGEREEDNRELVGDKVVEAEELLSATENMVGEREEDNHELVGDKTVEAEELLLSSENMAGEREEDNHGLVGDRDGEKMVKQEDVSEEKIEDTKEMKGDEDVVEEKAEDNQEMKGDAEGLLLVKQKEDEPKGVGGVVEGQMVVNHEDDMVKVDEMMTERKEEHDHVVVGDNGEGGLVVEQGGNESKGVEGDAEGEMEVNQEEDEEMGGEGEDEEMDDSQVIGMDSSPILMNDEELAGEGETQSIDTEMDTEAETGKSGSSGGKRRRGRNSKAAPAKTPTRKIVGEDVCFICLDGGDLVLCDRRGCPKTYHPQCVDHDEEFFKTKDRWTCGWHLCNKCGKNARFMCYTCTFSLCKGCSKDAVIFCVRENKGFCELCMKTVTMIENSEQNEGQVPFDDKSSWDFLFKDYWIEQKRRFSITSEELAQAKNPWKSSGAIDKQQMIGELHKGDIDIGSDSENSLENVEVTNSKRKKGRSKSKSMDSDTDSSSEKDVNTTKRKGKRRLKSQTKESYSDLEHSSGNEDASIKKGKKPKRLLKSRSKGGSTSSTANVRNSAEWATKELIEFVMHMKHGDKSALTQFDVQGLLLEYIKRNKLRDPRRQSQIICDPMLQKLFGKPRVGHFEMLKLLESHFLLKEDPQADDNHGSVVDEASQLDADDNADSTLGAGRSKGRKSRRRGEDRGLPSNLDDYAAIDMHNINLIYLRRNLMEALMEDSETFHDKVVGCFVRIRISCSTQKQDIYRLVQIIGTSKAAEPYRVGKRTTHVMLEILNLDKTEIVAIDTISNQEFTEDECNRLRQSIKCGLLSRMSLGDILEKARELQEARVTDWLEAEIVRLSHLRDRASDLGRKKELRECVEKLQLLKTPEERQRRLEEIPEVHTDPKMDPSYQSEDETEMVNKRRVSNMRPRESGFFRRDSDRDRDNFSRKGGSISNDSWNANARPPNKNWELNRNSSGKGFSSRREDTNTASQTTNEHTWNNEVDKETPGSYEKPRPTSDLLMSTRPESTGISAHTPSVALQTDTKVNDTEKIWHYRDPSGKVQGPFSMAQLRKWSNTGYFPAELKIWKASKSDDCFILTEALAGRFQKQSVVSPKATSTPSSIESSRNPRGSEPAIKYDSSSLPSPTPGRSTCGGWGGKKTSESKWSTTYSPFRQNNQFKGRGERLPSPTPTSPSTTVPSGLDRSNLKETVTPPIMQPSSITNPTGQYFSTPVVPRPAVPLNSGSINAQQISSQSVANQASSQPDGNMAAAQSFSNVVLPQNATVYAAQGWAAGSNTNMMPSQSNTVAPQVPYGQWTGGSMANQPSAYGAGYPPSNFPAMPSQNNAWRPTNMPWGGQPQQQPMNSPNMGWAEQPSAAAFGPPAGAMGPTPGALGWSGSGPIAGNANPMGWVGRPGNAGTWTGDQNRWGGGGVQFHRQPSFGSGGGGQGQGVCRFHESGHCLNGSACNYMHT